MKLIIHHQLIIIIHSPHLSLTNPLRSTVTMRVAFMGNVVMRKKHETVSSIRPRRELELLPWSRGCGKGLAWFLVLVTFTFKAFWPLLPSELVTSMKVTLTRSESRSDLLSEVEDLGPDPSLTPSCLTGSWKWPVDTWEAAKVYVLFLFDLATALTMRELKMRMVTKGRREYTRASTQGQTWLTRTSWPSAKVHEWALLKPQNSACSLSLVVQRRWKFKRRVKANRHNITMQAYLGWCWWLIEELIDGWRSDWYVGKRSIDFFAIFDMILRMYVMKVLLIDW